MECTIASAPALMARSMIIPERRTVISLLVSVFAAPQHSILKGHLRTVAPIAPSRPSMLRGSSLSSKGFTRMRRVEDAAVIGHDPERRKVEPLLPGDHGDADVVVKHLDDVLHLD